MSRSWEFELLCLCSLSSELGCLVCAVVDSEDPVADLVEVYESRFLNRGRGL